MPVLATISLSTHLVTVTFDRPLTPGVSAAGNWTGSTGIVFPNADMNFFGTLGVAGTTVTGTPNLVPPITHPRDTISYAASPADVFGATGTPVAAFTDFPLASVP